MLFLIGEVGGFWLVTRSGLSGVTRSQPAGRAVDTILRIQDVETAERIVDGRSSALGAFLSGKIKVSGNADLASRHLRELLGP